MQNKKKVYKKLLFDINENSRQKLDKLPMYFTWIDDLACVNCKLDRNDIDYDLMGNVMHNFLFITNIRFLYYKPENKYFHLD